MATNCPQHVKPRACRSAYVRFTSAWNSVRGNRLRSWLNMLENRVTGEPPWWWRVEACRPRHHHTPRGLTRSQTLIWTRVTLDKELQYAEHPFEHAKDHDHRDENGDSSPPLMLPHQRDRLIIVRSVVAEIVVGDPRCARDHGVRRLQVRSGDLELNRARNDVKSCSESATGKQILEPISLCEIWNAASLKQRLCHRDH